MRTKPRRETWPTEDRQSHRYVHGIGMETDRFTLCLTLKLTVSVPLPKAVFDEMCDYVDGTVKNSLARQARKLTAHCATGFDYEDMAYSNYMLTKLTPNKGVRVELGVECCTSNWPEEDPGLQSALDVELAKFLPLYLTHLTSIADNAVLAFYATPSSATALSDPSTPSGAEPQADIPTTEDPFEQAVGTYASNLQNLLGSLDGNGLEALLRGTLKLDPEVAKSFAGAADALLQARKRFFGPTE